MTYDQEFCFVGNYMNANAISKISKSGSREIFYFKNVGSYMKYFSFSVQRKIGEEIYS